MQFAAKIAQMFMVGIQGEAPAREERLLFERYGFGGFVLFSHNCRSPQQIVALCRALWENPSELRPFIAIDHEGGRVQRLPEPFTRFPSAAAIGQAGSPRLAYLVGLAAARELALIGVNLNFAPVLDVNTNPANPIIGDRAFGNDPDKVIRTAHAWTQGLRDGGIIPCGKHFPGHGSTDRDSHLDLPVVEKSLEGLKAVELAPFVHACRDRIEALMTAHMLYRALDPAFPATLSERIVTGLLRQELGYGGVVFSDDMEMRAIGANFSEAEAVGLSVSAGVDVVLYCHDLAKAVRAVEWLSGEAERRPALRARVEESFERIARLKAKSLKIFTAAGEKEIAARLASLPHRRLLEPHGPAHGAKS
jgi:beta-N-acetylhexosaminidase